MRLGLRRETARIGAGVVAMALVVGGAVISGNASDGDRVRVAAEGVLPEIPGAARSVPEVGVVDTPGESDPAGSRLGAVVIARRQADRTVAVERRDLDTGEVEQLFEYRDARPDRGPEDHSQPDHASVALSPDGRRVAYSDSRSIRVRHLGAGEVTTVVEGVPQGEYLPLRWSIEAMNTDPATDGVWGIWAVDGPQWSPDGKRLAFHQGWWEGSDFGVVDLATGGYHATPGGTDLEWVPGDDADRTVVAGSSYTEPGRVHASRPGRPADYADVSERLGGPAERSYVGAAPSPDGGQLVVSWQAEALYGPRCCAALVTTDGTLIRELPVDGTVQSAAFGPDGSAVYVAERRERRTVLMRHPLTGGAPTEVLALPADLYSWTITPRADGLLALTGQTRLPYEAAEEEPGACEQDCPPYRSRLLIVDPATGGTRHSSDLGRHTATGGFDLYAD